MKPPCCWARSSGGGVSNKALPCNALPSAGISRGLVQRIERGDKGCAIGSVFEAAAIVGLPLFDASLSELRASAVETDKMLRLLSHAVHRPRKAVEDDF